jgi:hypothetical protein
VIDRNHSLNYHTKCIKEFSQGPCEAGEEYSWNYETNKPECQDIEIVHTKYLETPCKENLIPYTDRNGKIECYEENSQGPCKNNPIYIPDWESVDLVIPLCGSQAVVLRQPSVIGGFSTCPRGKVKDTRGVCKRALKFRKAGRKPTKKDTKRRRNRSNLRRFLRLRNSF